VKPILLSIISAAVLAAGCGQEEAAPEQDAGLLVGYQRSGGIAGVLEELRVSQSGRATVTTGVDAARESFALGKAELERLRSELEAANLSDPDFQPGGVGCADCFEYEIEAAGNQVRLDDLDRPGDALGALLGHLGKLVADHHPAGAAKGG
jgi:hypothetical protein